MSDTRDNQFGRFSRRRALEAAGLAAGSLFLPSLIGEKKALAGGPPKRIVFFRTFHGPPHAYWKMRRPNLPEEADWEFPLDDPDPMSFSEILRGLHPYRNDLLLLDGLAYTCFNADFPGNAHDMSSRYSMTGGGATSVPNTAPDQGYWPTTQVIDQRLTVDQIIANQVKAPQRFDYLNYSSDYGVQVAGIATPTNPAVYVTQAYDRIFKDVTSGPPLPSDNVLTAAQAREKRLLSFVKSRYDVTLQKLSSEDRTKLSLHRAMINDLEARITAFKTLRCEKPANPYVSPPNDADMKEYDSSKQAQDFLSTLYPVAMACDLTRVALYYHNGYPGWQFAQPGDNIGGEMLSSIAKNDVHAKVAHMGEGIGGGGKLMAQYYQLHVKEFAGMIEAFKSVPEMTSTGAMGTMLDNSVLVWLPELGNGPHNIWNLKIVLAGNCGGAFRTGRYIRYGNTRPNPMACCLDTRMPVVDHSYLGSDNGGLIGPPHNKLLVSLMNAMGVDRNSIGLEHAKGKNGEPIDLTGPLTELR